MALFSCSVAVKRLFEAILGRSDRKIIREYAPSGDKMIRPTGFAPKLSMLFPLASVNTAETRFQAPLSAPASCAQPASMTATDNAQAHVVRCRNWRRGTFISVPYV